MKDVLKIQWVDVRGESRQGRQLQKSCPCSWKGESPKRFPESSRCHWDQSKPFWFQTLVVHDDQLYSGMLQQSKKIKPEQFKRLQTAKWTYWEKFSLSLSPSHSLLVDLTSSGTAGALPAQHSPGTPCFPQQPPRQDILLKYWVMTWQAQQELVKGTLRYYQFHSLCPCLGLLLQPPGSAVPCSCTFTAKEITSFLLHATQPLVVCKDSGLFVECSASLMQMVTAPEIRKK